MGVAFMDVGVYVTSLRTLKNLLLIGDAVKSAMFVAFQVCSFFFSTRYAGKEANRFIETGGSI